MYPGLSDADCQVAAFRHRQLVAEGQRQQFVAGASPASGVTRAAPRPVRRQVGAFLVGAGQRLQGMQAVTRKTMASTPTGEANAIS